MCVNVCSIDDQLKSFQTLNLNGADLQRKKNIYAVYFESTIHHCCYLSFASSDSISFSARSTCVWSPAIFGSIPKTKSLSSLVWMK